MWTLPGMNCPWIHWESSESEYDSASSRAHAPHAGAALKSISTGRISALALLSVESRSWFHSTAIFVVSLVRLLFT